MNIRFAFSALALLLLVSGCSASINDSIQPSTLSDHPIYTINDISHDSHDVIRSCNRSSGSGILLSFDDDGTETQVNAILDALVEENVQAAFFPTGDWVLENLALVERMKSDGHIVGNHTQTHARLGVLSEEDPDTFYSEIYPLEHVANTSPILIRPPYEDGAYDKSVADRVEEKGMQLCTWTVDTYDWSGDTISVMMNRVEFGDEYSPTPLGPDAVVLLHMSSPHAAEMVHRITRFAESRGYVMAPLDR